MLASSMPMAEAVGLSGDAQDFDRIVGQLARKLNADQQMMDLRFVSAQDRISRNYECLPALQPVECAKIMHLPDFILRQIDDAESKCFMGLFPAIDRLWLSIDHRLFLWDYKTGADFYSYEGMPDVIVSVALLKPRQGVFPDDQIEYLIAVASNSEVRLLGVSVQSSGELSMYLTQISVSTDNVIFLSIVPLTNGQIFLAGHDGHLYELEYESEESWFKRKCSLVNHTRSKLSLFIPTFLSIGRPDPLISLLVDEDRRLLYTLSESSVITVYEMDLDERRLFKLTPLISKRILDSVKNFIAGGSSSSPFDEESFRPFSLQLVSSVAKKPPSVISSVTFKDICLVAVTNRGYRLYLTCDRAAGSEMFSGFGHSPQLNLCHVRMMPTMDDERDAGLLTLPLTQFDTALCSRGVFMVGGASATTNSLFTAALDVGVQAKRRQFHEWTALSYTNERLWSIAESSSNAIPAFMKHCDCNMNELASQVINFPQSYYLLTNRAIYMMICKRPIDVLVALLGQSHGQETEELRRFFECYTEEQICAMLLAVICENRFAMGTREAARLIVPDGQLKTWASHYFYRFGSLGQLVFDFKHGEDYDVARPMASANEYFSISYHAFLLYFSRLIRPVWSVKLMDFSEPAMVPLLNSVMETCFSLRDFLVHFYQTTQTLPQSERSVLGSLLNFVDLVVQGCQMMIILTSANLTSLIERIKERHGQFAKSCVFSTLITGSGGRVLVKDLTKTLIDDIISSNSRVDAICDSLRDKCPAFFNADDVKIFKAMELIQSAQYGQELDPRRSLEEALRLLLDAAASITAEQLQRICESYRLLDYPEGALRLAISCAQKVDSANVALELYRSSGDVLYNNESKEIAMRRVEYYAFAFELIDGIIDSIPSNISIEALENIYRTAPVIAETLRSKDEYFHYLFFDHMLSKKQLIYILKVTDDPYLEKYLEQRQYERSEYGLYLCLFYRHLKNYDKAIIKLHEYAVSPKFPATLEKRIELLSLALSISEGKLAAAVDGGLLEDIQDLLDVANVQWELYRAVDTNPDFGGYKLAEMNQRIFNVTELYKIANELNLPEIKLSIFYISNHREDALLTQTWQQILTKAGTVDEKFNKIVELGQRYHHSEIVFPVELLVPLVETEQITQANESLRNQWLVQALLEVGYSFEEVFSVYDRMFMEKSPPFHDREGQCYLLEKLTVLIEDWFESKSLQNFNPRLVVEKISGYIAFISSSADIVSKNQDLLKILRDMERKLKNIF